MKFYLTLVILLAVFPTYAQESHPKIVFQAGNTYRYVVSTTFEMEVPKNPQASRRVELQHHARLDALSAEQLQASTERLVLSLSMGGKTIDFDSTDPDSANSKMAKHFSSSLSRNVTVTISPEGRILSSNEGGGGGALTPFPGLPQFGGPNELKQLIVSLFQGLPAEPVSPGDEWKQRDTRQLAEFGDMEFDISYKYLGEKEEAAEDTSGEVIHYVGAMRGDVSLGAGNSGGAGSERIAFDGSRLEGTIVFDAKSQTVVESKQNVDMTVSVPNPQMDQRLNLPVKQRTVIRLTGFEKTAS